MVQASRRSAAARRTLRLATAPCGSPGYVVRFGERGYSFHPGVDIDAPPGAPVHPSAAGLVVAAGEESGYRYRAWNRSRLLLHARSMAPLRRVAVALGLLALLVLLASAPGNANHDRKHPFAGSWIIDPKGKAPGKLQPRVVGEARAGRPGRASATAWSA